MEFPFLENYFCCLLSWEEPVCTKNISTSNDPEERSSSSEVLTTVWIYSPPGIILEVFVAVQPFNQKDVLPHFHLFPPLRGIRPIGGRSLFLLWFPRSQSRKVLPFITEAKAKNCLGVTMYLRSSQINTDAALHHKPSFILVSTKAILKRKQLHFSAVFTWFLLRPSWMPCEISGYEKDCFFKNAMFCDEIQHCKLSSIIVFVIHKYNMEMWLFGQITVFHIQVSIAI